MRRRTPGLLAAVTVAALLAACGAEPTAPEPTAPTAPQPTAPTAPQPTAPTDPSLSPPTGAPPPAATPSPGPTGGGTRPTPSRSTRPTPEASMTSGELPGGLPWGTRTLTGTVERSAACVLLRVGERRWALTGAPAAGLTAGDRVTVAGTLTPMPAECVDRATAPALQITSATPA